MHILGVPIDESQAIRLVQNKMEGLNQVTVQIVSIVVLELECNGSLGSCPGIMRSVIHHRHVGAWYISRPLDIVHALRETHEIHHATLWHCLHCLQKP